MPEGRNSNRHAVTIPGRYRTGSGIVREVSLVDISESGCRFYDKFCNLTLRQIISLRIENLGPFEAQVVWEDRQWVGVAFTRPVYGPVFDHIVSELDSPEWRPERHRRPASLR